MSYNLLRYIISYLYVLYFKYCFKATSTDIKPERKLNIGLISDQKIRKKLFSGPTIEDLERRNKELIIENLKIHQKSRKLLRKMVNLFIFIK